MEINLFPSESKFSDYMLGVCARNSLQLPINDGTQILKVGSLEADATIRRPADIVDNSCVGLEAHTPYLFIYVPNDGCMINRSNRTQTGCFPDGTKFPLLDSTGLLDFGALQGICKEIMIVSSVCIKTVLFLHLLPEITRFLSSASSTWTKV